MQDLCDIVAPSPKMMSSDKWNHTKTHSGEGVAEAHSPAAQGVIYGSGGSSSFQAPLEHLARLMVAILHGVGGGHAR